MTNLRRQLCASLLVTGVSGINFLWYCDISTRPVVDLVHDPASGATYEWIPDGGNRVLGRQSSLHSSVDEEAVNRRDLETHKSLRSNVDEAWSSSVVHARRMEDGVDTSKWIRFSARECWCANRDPMASNMSLYYCMTPYTHCGIPPRGADGITPPPGCVSRAKTEFEKGAWPVIIVWFSFLFAWVCCTQSGRQVYGFLISFFFPGWNTYVTNRMMRNDPERANQLIRHYWRQQGIALEARYLQMMAELRDEHQAEDGQEVSTLPNELALKTRIFKKSAEALAVSAEDLGDDDSDCGDDAACAICFGPLNDGDRVGVLVCDHIFHVDCLRLWLVRRNTCPLCQMQDAATPRYTPREQDEDEVAPMDVAAGQEIQEQPNEQEQANAPLAPETHETPAQVWQNGLQEASMSNRRRRRYG